MDNRTIGQIISQHRKEKGMTQKSLAEQLNVTDKAVSKWERDVARPDINTIPKLAEILNIPIELLINIPISTKAEVEEDPSAVLAEQTTSKVAAESKIEDEWDYECEAHKDNARRLLLKGLLGFAAGVLFVIITSMNDNDPFDLSFALIIGLLLAGVPYGWELLGKIIDQWYVVGNIAIMILMFCFKLVGAILVGWAAYPIALFYNVMKSQRKGSNAKKLWTVVFCVNIIVIVALAFVILFAGFIQEHVTSDDDMTEATQTMNKYAQVDVAAITDAQPQLVTICEKTLNLCEAEEKESEATGTTTIIPSTIQAVYYLKTRDPDSQHVDYGRNIRFTNAVVVVTYNRVNIGNWVERDSWTVWLYPDFSRDAEKMMHYEEEKEYALFIGEQTLTTAYQFICEEYYDMDVYELDVPPHS